MFRYFIVLASLMTPSAQAQDSPPSAQKIIETGEYSQGETALLLVLDQNPRDDETRFGLGVVQFLHAVERLGQALYEYGAVSENTREMFLRLPVPKNEHPATISYREIGRVLDEFATGLRRAEATLADVTDDDVKLKLRLADISFDFTRTGENRTTLGQLIGAFNARFPKKNPDLQIHFDRGDVAWLRSYCHLMCGVVEGYRAVDAEPGFNDRVDDVFPKTEPRSKKVQPDWHKFIQVVDAPRLRRMREHFVKVGALNHETWKHIRAETDDDFEWLPHPKQTDQMNLPLTDAQIDAWLNFMTNLEELMTGERLIPSGLLHYVDNEVTHGQGLNVKTLLDDPPADLFHWERIQKDGIDQKYTEDESKKKQLDLGAIFRMLQLFNGPFGFARAARMN